MSHKNGMQRPGRAALVMAAAAAVLAACGGGGSAPADPGAPRASLQISGTVAVGQALAAADVQIQCEAGSGSATTDGTGKYSAAIEGGALPCMLRAAGQVAGNPVVLHSIAGQGKPAVNGIVSAFANITPLTEIILARMTAMPPTQLFAGLGADPIGSFSKLAEFMNQQATAIRQVMDLLHTNFPGPYAGADPFTDELEAATPGNPTSGNDHDKALDLLGEALPPQALPVFVTQVANAAGTGSTSVLEEVVGGLAGGSLENCPVAISGKYRTIDVTGEMKVHTADFKAGTWRTEGSDTPVAIVPSATQPCEFSLGWTTVVMGPDGVGAFHRTDGSGLLFPVQSHTLASVAGNWNFLQSGVDESNQGEHFFGRLAIAIDGKATVCGYNVMTGNGDFGACEPDAGTGVITAAADGGFELAHGPAPARLFGYRAPDNALFVFGTTNPAGSWSPPDLRTHIVLVRPQALAAPAVGTVTKHWDISSAFNGNFMDSEPLAADANTVTAVDAAAGSFTRTRASDGRVDTLLLNKPVEGLRYRALNGSVPSIFQLPIASLGIALTIDNTVSPTHTYSISVVRP